MKGIALVAVLAREAGAAGRPAAEAFLRLLEEERDPSTEYFRKVVERLPPHRGKPSGMVPSRRRRP